MPWVTQLTRGKEAKYSEGPIGDAPVFSPSYDRINSD